MALKLSAVFLHCFYLFLGEKSGFMSDIRNGMYMTEITILLLFHECNKAKLLQILAIKYLI
jgi:hypothetical protein